MRVYAISLRAFVCFISIILLSSAGLAQEQGQSCLGCDLSGQDLSQKEIIDANLTRADLEDANFSGSTIKGSSFAFADLSGASFSNVTLAFSDRRANSFSGANLQGSDFSGATAHAADFGYADLSCANFTNANLEGASFVGANFASASECQLQAQGARVTCVTAQRHPALVQAGAIVPSGCGLTLSTAATTSDQWYCPSLESETQFDKTVYVSSSGTDSSSCGASSSGTPCQTISAAVSQCTGTSCGVLVYYGSYSPSATISVPSEVSMYGGCLDTSNTDNSYSVLEAPADGQPAFSMDDVSGVTISGMQISGGVVTSDDASPSVTVEVVNGSSDIHFENITIIGGTGANGVNGVDATNGIAGGSASNQTGAAGPSSCSIPGGDGGPGMTTHVDYNFTSVTNCPSQCGSSGGSSSSCYGDVGTSGQSTGGSGGTTNHAYCELACISNCPSSLNAAGGKAGSNGSCGANGAASAATAGSFVNGQWVASFGGNGTAGKDGGGGGGGGGGAACGYVCFWVPANKSGAHGGGGGSGACGATEATGGQQGGASIGMQISSSSVTFQNVNFTGGLGGNGGKGGKGGKSAAGGSGASGADASGASPHAGDGGHGGSGGWGGQGGAGAGGNGGPALGIAFDSTTESDLSSVSFIQGRQGVVGDAGDPSGTVSGAPCTVDGSPVDGAGGLVKDYQSFN